MSTGGLSQNPSRSAMTLILTGTDLFRSLLIRLEMKSVHSFDCILLLAQIIQNIPLALSLLINTLNLLSKFSPVLSTCSCTIKNNITFGKINRIKFHLLLFLKED